MSLTSLPAPLPIYILRSLPPDFDTLCAVYSSCSLFRAVVQEHAVELFEEAAKSLAKQVVFELRVSILVYLKFEKINLLEWASVSLSASVGRDRRVNLAVCRVLRRYHYCQGVCNTILKRKLDFLDQEFARLLRRQKIDYVVEKLPIQWVEQQKMVRIALYMFNGGERHDRRHELVSLRSDVEQMSIDWMKGDDWVSIETPAISSICWERGEYDIDQVTYDEHKDSYYSPWRNTDYRRVFRDMGFNVWSQRRMRAWRLDHQTPARIWHRLYHAGIVEFERRHCGEYCNYTRSKTRYTPITLPSWTNENEPVNWDELSAVHYCGWRCAPHKCLSPEVAAVKVDTDSDRDAKEYIKVTADGWSASGQKLDTPHYLIARGLPFLHRRS